MQIATLRFRVLYCLNINRRVSWLKEITNALDFNKLNERDPGLVLGTNLRILKYPAPQLRSKNQAIVNFDNELQDIVNGMLLIMNEANAYGLAAPQVGVNLQLMVFSKTDELERPISSMQGNGRNNENVMILANPSIVAKSSETWWDEEGCLSFPDINALVERHEWIEVEYQTITGQSSRCRFDHLEARIFQHEYDHLDQVSAAAVTVSTMQCAKVSENKQILFIDRLVPQEKRRLKHYLNKCIKTYGEHACP